MSNISREELKAKLDRGDNFKLVMVNSELGFNSLHIPGSVHYNTADEAYAHLDQNAEIVVYCNDPICVASTTFYRMLEQRGYRNIIHYKGGLTDWEQAGYPLEGELAK
jgi:rhodanese-related sulfurtransferase